MEYVENFQYHGNQTASDAVSKIYKEPRIKKGRADLAKLRNIWRLDQLVNVSSKTL